MNKGVFIDLDGTLLDDQHQLSMKTKKVVNELLQRNVAVYLVTGMSLENALKIYNQLNLNTYLSTSMGQMICKPNEQKQSSILHTTNLDASLSAINNIASKTKVHNFVLEFSTGESVASKIEDDSHLLSFINSTNIQLIDNANIKDKKVISISVELEDSDIENLTQLVNGLNDTSTIFMHEYWIPDKNLPIVHLRTKTYGKWEAVSYIIEHDKLDEVYAFGNGWNDRFILQNVNNSYAMLNANSKVKSYARNITEFDNNHDGVAIELKKLIDKNIL